MSAIPPDIRDAAHDVAWQWTSSMTSEEFAEIIARALQAERERAAGIIQTLVESLQEGLMTDAGLSAEDRVAMRHQINALDEATAAILSPDTKEPKT